MPPVKIVIEDTSDADKDQQLSLFKTMVIAFLLRAGGSATFTEAEWPENKSYSFVHGMDDTGEKLIITLTKE